MAVVLCWRVQLYLKRELVHLIKYKTGNWNSSMMWTLVFDTNFFLERRYNRAANIWKNGGRQFRRFFRSLSIKYLQKMLHVCRRSDYFLSISCKTVTFFPKPYIARLHESKLHWKVLVIDEWTKRVAENCCGSFTFCGWAVFFVVVVVFFCSLQGLIYALVKEVCKHFCSACSVILVQRLFIKAGAFEW